VGKERRREGNACAHGSQRNLPHSRITHVAATMLSVLLRFLGEKGKEFAK